MSEIDKKLFEQEQDEAMSQIIAGLESRPEYHFSKDFEKAILERMSLPETQSDVDHYWVLAISIAVFVVLGFAGIWYALGWEGLSGMKTTLLYAAGTALLVGVFQYLDQVLVRRSVHLT